jgi:hypothetical protein
MAPRYGAIMIKTIQAIFCTTVRREERMLSIIAKGTKTIHGSSAKTTMTISDVPSVISAIFEFLK